MQAAANEASCWNLEQRRALGYKGLSSLCLSNSTTPGLFWPKWHHLRATYQTLHRSLWRHKRLHLFFPYAVLPKPCKQTLMCKIFSPLNCVWRPSLHSVKRSSKQLLYEEIDWRWDQVIWGHYMFVSEMQIKSFSCRDQPSVCFAQHDTTGIALIHVITLLSIHLFHRLDACQRIRFFFKDKSTILFDGSVMWMGEGLFAVLLRVVEKICIALTSAAVNMELQPSTA